MTDRLVNNADSPGASSKARRSVCRWSGQYLQLAALVLSIVAAYFMTIQSLKVELADKAESTLVETLDKKLAGLEVVIREGMVSRSQFYEFSRDVEARLIRIEDHLTANSGVNVGKR